MAAKVALQTLTNLPHQDEQNKKQLNVLTRAAAARLRTQHNNQPSQQYQTNTNNDPQYCAPYADDIHQFLKQKELNHTVDPNFMQNQRDINATMRGILVDWLVEVGEEYRLQSETLFLAVNYIDRFLSYVLVARAKLQLVGVACMLVASKFEDVRPPAVDEFVYISDNTYSRDEILKMEGALVSRLQFDLSVATSLPFLYRYTHLAQILGKCDSTIVALSQYLLELTLQEYRFLKYRPSERAAAALWLAMHTVRVSGWDCTMEAGTEYTARELYPCVTELHEMFQNAETSSLQAVREKYSHAKFLCVSLLRPAQSVPDVA